MVLKKSLLYILGSCSLVLAVQASSAAVQMAPVRVSAPDPNIQWHNWESFDRGSTQWTTDGEGGLIDGKISGDVASNGDHAFGGRVVMRDLKKNPKTGFL